MDKIDLPDWKIERYILGELDYEQMNIVPDLIKKDPTIKNRYKSIQKQNQEFHDKYPAKKYVNRIMEKVFIEEGRMSLSKKKDFNFKKFILVPSIGFSFVLIMFLFIMPLWENQNGLNGNKFNEITRIKGDDASILY